MQKFFVLLLAASFIISCKDNNEPAEKEKEPQGGTTEVGKEDKPPIVINILEKLLGSYVGAFGDNKITLLITKAAGDSVIGRSIVGGNDRPFAGTVVEKEGMYNVSAKEPGDHPDDGVFTFSVKADSTSGITGSWQPNNPKKPAKEYTLKRKLFAYNPAVGDYPQASQRLLKAKDVENMYKEDLMFMRNEIFARHGYCFKKKDLRQEFEMQNWYVPNTVDIKGFLTDVEKKNIELIKRYEKYAEEYGDEYGR
jgi:hypothetical protein